MELQLKIAIGCDLAAYDFKMNLLEILRGRGYDINGFRLSVFKRGRLPGVWSPCG